MDMDFHGLSLNLRGRQILDGVSGAFRQGQVTVILGANGAGKSSLLSCLAGLRTPDRGQIKLGGRSLAVFDRRERARMIGLLSRSEEHTSELQSLMRISYAVFCLKQKKQ